MADPRQPHRSSTPPDAPEHQPVVDAFTDLPQTEAERPQDRDVDADDMFVQGGE